MKNLGKQIKELERLLKNRPVEEIKTKNQEIWETCKKLSKEHRHNDEIVRALLLITNSCADLDDELKTFGTDQRTKSLRIITTMKLDLERIAKILNIELFELLG